LLQEEPMPRFSSMRLLALAATLVILIVSGLQVTAASAAYASRFMAPEAPASARTPQTGIPFGGYQTEQDGSGVVLGPFAWTEYAPVQSSREADPPQARRLSATVRNITSEKISALRFIAVVEEIPFTSPVRIFTSELTTVSIAPGQSAEIPVKVLSLEQLQQVAAAPPNRVQVFFGLQAVRFANGAEWHITPNPTATYHEDALGIPRTEIPRELLATTAATSATRDSLCRDQNGRGYSQGALVPVRNEPGKFARCNNGRWEESARR
jgi:hypothetical protein